MGNDRFSRSVYTAYHDSHKLKSASRDQVFTQNVKRQINESLDPMQIALRESHDSQANPNSTGIIIGLDVTGSMGFVAQQIATESLPDIFENIYKELPVTDPHVMFMAIGDVMSDIAPLQASQFEAGAVPLTEQLRKLWIEGNGGGNCHESYDGAWYFALHRTQLDCFTKRGKKGYLITMGDELPPNYDLNHRPTAHGLTLEDVRRIFGTAGELAPPGTTKQLLADVSEKYKVFHLVIEQGSFAQGRKEAVNSAWASLLGPNAIRVRNIAFLPQIITATLKVANGVDMNEVFREANNDVRAELKYAFSNAFE